MSKLTKTLLILAIVSLVAGLAINSGLINAKDADVLYAVFPLGAVFAGLFLICKLLEKESARYDAEHRAAEEPHGSEASLKTR